MYFTCYFFSLDFILVVPFFTFYFGRCLHFISLCYLTADDAEELSATVVDGTFIISPEGIENLKPLTLVTLQTCVAVFMCFNLHVFQPPQDVFASYNEMDIIHINALCWPHSLVFLLSFISEQLPSGLCFLLPEECLLLCLCQLVSENVYFILQHLLMLKEAVQWDWSQESVDIKLWVLTSLMWSGPMQLAFCVWCFLVSIVPVETPLLWKLFSAGCSLGLFHLCFVWVVFHPHGSMCDSVLPLLFGVCMALGLTPQVVLWLHSLLSLWSSSY